MMALSVVALNLKAGFFAIAIYWALMGGCEARWFQEGQLALIIIAK